MKPSSFSIWDEAERALQVGHPVVEAEHVVVGHEIGFGAGVPLLLRDARAVIAEPANARRDGVVVRRDHAAFARGHRLARVEGEGRDIPEPAGEALAQPGAGGAGGVLDHGHGLRQSGAQSLRLRAKAEEMHRHHRARPLRHCGERLLHVHVEGEGVDIDEDRGAPQ